MLTFLLGVVAGWMCALWFQYREWKSKPWNHPPYTLDGHDSKTQGR
jgi:hypothetical protein